MLGPATKEGRSLGTRFGSDVVRDVDHLAALRFKVEGKFLEARKRFPDPAVVLFFDVEEQESAPACAEKFAAEDACLVADTYTTAWCGSMKYIREDDFLDTMAEGYSRIYLNIGVDEMARQVIEMAEKYEVDGIVMHSNRSCKPYSFGQYDIQRIVREKKGIPTLMIEADMVDERSFSESQIENRIDAFIEILKAKKSCLLP